jgi:hypothetical protein
MEIWVGSKQLVLCSGYFSFQVYQNRYLTIRDRGTLSIRYKLCSTVTKIVVVILQKQPDSTVNMKFYYFSINLGGYGNFSFNMSQ